MLLLLLLSKLLNVYYFNIKWLATRSHHEDVNVIAHHLKMREHHNADAATPAKPAAEPAKPASEPAKPAATSSASAASTGAYCNII